MTTLTTIPMPLAEPQGDVWICQGPPWCLMEGDEAVDAQEAGCPWCRVVRVYEDGTEEVIQDPRANGNQ